MANAELAQEILYQLESKPSMHDQRTWFKKATQEKVYVLRPEEEFKCGTTLCVAGWAAHLGGYTLTHYESNGIPTASLPFSPLRQIPDVARELLDLSEMDSFIFFHYTSDEETKMVLEQIINGRDHIEWTDIFGDDSEGIDYLESVMDAFYGESDYSYDYEN